jgi:hypothetical protein
VADPALTGGRLLRRKIKFIPCSVAFMRRKAETFSRCNGGNQIKRRSQMQVSRRQFFKICGAGMSGSSIALMGFSPTSALAEVRSYKLAHATETRNMCPYCSVSCGVLIYTTGDKSKNAKADIIHIEGDPDNPVNRGTLCPKGAGLMDMVKSPTGSSSPKCANRAATSGSASPGMTPSAASRPI